MRESRVPVLRPEVRFDQDSEFRTRLELVALLVVMMMITMTMTKRRMDDRWLFLEGRQISENTEI